MALQKTQHVTHQARAAGIVAVHAAAYRRTAVTTQSDGRLYVLVPDPAAGPDHTASRRPGVSPGHQADAKLLTWTVELVTTLRRHLGSPVQAAIAQPAPRLDDAPTARRSADRILRVMGRDPERTVATYAQVKAAVVLDEILGLLAENPTVHDPALRRLAEHDRRNGTELCESLLRYLDAFGEVKEVAAGLHIHPNTLRHRIRRAAQLSGVDLADPDQRLVALLELRRMRAPARRP
ncbi:PucR family transcriptional regulator [Streptomyces sp. NPDC001914]|uniref:PucR family transcriptional regulator n=1 Tax=Streptomyces sp. NPDC001914 TaxID=3364623 RepID=UPI00369B6E0E